MLSFVLADLYVFCFGCALPGLSSHSSGWRVQCLGSAGYCTDVAEFKISLSVSRCVTLVSILSLSSDYDNAIAPDHSSCKGLWKTWLTHFIYDLLVSKSCFRHKASSKQFHQEWEAKTNLALIYLRNYYLIHITGQKLYRVFFLKKLFKDVHDIKKDYNKNSFLTNQHIWMISEGSCHWRQE